MECLTIRTYHPYLTVVSQVPWCIQGLLGCQSSGPWCPWRRASPRQWRDGLSDWSLECEPPLPPLPRNNKGQRRMEEIILIFERLKSSVGRVTFGQTIRRWILDSVMAKMGATTVLSPHRISTAELATPALMSAHGLLCVCVCLYLCVYTAAEWWASRGHCSKEIHVSCLR